MTDYERRLLKTLESSVENLRALREQIKAIREDQQPNDNGRSKRPLEPLRIRIMNAPGLDPARQEYYQAENRERNSRRKQLAPLLAGGGVLAAFALAVLTLLTFLQIKDQTPRISESAGAATKAIQTSIETGIEQFRVDERAWIEIDSIRKTSLPASPGFPASFKYEVFLKNVGKTMAKDAVLRRVSSLGPMPNEGGVELAQKELLTPKSGRPPQVPPYPIPRAFAPNTALAIPFNLGGSPPKYKNTFYSSSIGRIDYMDEFGVSHWMTFCLIVMNAAGDLQYCDYGNDEDRNPEVSLPAKR